MAGPCPTKQVLKLGDETYEFANSTEFKAWLQDRDNLEKVAKYIDLNKFKEQPPVQDLIKFVRDEAKQSNLAGEKLWERVTEQLKEKYPNINEKFLASAKEEIMVGANLATGIKRAVVEQERQARLAEPIDTKFLSRSDQDIYNRAQQMIESGEFDPREQAQYFAENPQNATAEQQAAFAIDRVKLNKLYEEVGEKFIEAVREGDTVKSGMLATQIDSIQKAIDFNDRAVSYAGTKLSESFRIRRRVLGEDFSLLKLRIDYFKDNPTEKTVPADMLAKLKEFENEVNDIKSRLTKIEEDRQRAEAEAAVENIKETVEEEQKTATKEEVKEPVKRKYKHLNDSQSQELSNLSQKFKGVMNDITRIASLIADKDFYRYVQLNYVEAAGDFKAFAKELIKGVGKGIRSHVPALWKEMGGDMADVSKDYTRFAVEERAKELIASGVTNVTDIVSTIHKEMLPENPKLTEREVRDTLTEYGKQIKPKTKDDLEKLLDIAKREGVLISKIEDAREGKTPLRKILGGREKPTDTERKYQRELNKLLKDLPADATEQYRKIKTAQDRKITSLENQIRDLDANIELAKQGLPIEVKDKSVIPDNDTIVQLRDERDAKQKELKELTKKADETDQEWLNRWKERAKKNIDKYKGMIERGEFTTKKTRNPKEIIKQEKDYEAAQLLGDLNKTKNKYKAFREAQQRKQRSTLARAFDTLSKIPRSVILTSTSVFGKLGSFSLGEMAIMPVKEAVQTAISKIPLFGQIIKGAPMQGGGSFETKAILKSWAEWTNPINLWKDIKNIYKTGQTVEMEKFTNEMPEVTIDYWDRINAAMDLSGKTHMMAKSPTLRAKTKLYFEKMKKYYEKAYNDSVLAGVANGENPNDPAFLLAMQAKAFQMAYDEILLGKNVVSEQWKSGTQYLERPKTEVSGTKAAARAMKGFIEAKVPIVKVPLNYINAVLDYSGVGLLKAGFNIVAAQSKTAREYETKFFAELFNYGFKRMSDADKEIITKNLVRGSIGAALFMYGYLNRDEIGGYPVTGEKRSKFKAQPWDMKLFGYDIPHWAHLPQLDAIMVGATFGHAMDYYKNRYEKGEKVGKLGAFGKGFTAVTKTELQKVPMLEEPYRIRNAVQDDAMLEQYLAEFAKSSTVPPDIQKRFYEIKPKPKTFWERYSTRKPTREEKERYKKTGKYRED